MEHPPVTQQPILYVDCTPDADYPLRVLRAHRENENVRWDLTGEFSDETRRAHEAMNKGCVKRAALLDDAIVILERERG